ncbi:MAG TPA: VOC family protein [Usitatibacter sp.]|jgi:hypothetical protein|nr:VOC family protein [Usitatibacter sp.]
MEYELDHLVVAARTLEEGGAWVEAALGAAPVAGGRHALMGTHNRVLALDRRRYLEVIAADPDAPPPARPRWFGLDRPAARERLARGPALMHWVARVPDIDAALRDYPDEVEVLDLTRGEFAWRIGVPRDGHLPCGGACPTLIEWQGAAHPADRLPPSGCALLELRTAPVLEAVFSTPRGRRTLPSRE